ncbi:hypothetical protein [Malaciobacter mytili]|uniref:hypothetical protein n=1 Tax=Malaciobacter mytili TaxID=603050 RepID=UPI000E106CCC|nr:hypothetical protein [Malaciobacter mytili]AXH15229.1 hypothetical protein AMYT_1655 [Malaciobacter mytili LMG 24559]
MLKKLLSIFKKKTYPCIVWDGKCMKYLDLTKKQIEEFRTLPKYKNYSVTINENPSK